MILISLANKKREVSQYFLIKCWLRKLFQNLSGCNSVMIKENFSFHLDTPSSWSSTSFCVNPNCVNSIFTHSSHDFPGRPFFLLLPITSSSMTSRIYELVCWRISLSYHCSGLCSKLFSIVTAAPTFFSESIIWNFFNFFLSHTSSQPLHKKWNFSIKDCCSKCDQIRSFQRIWSHLLKKSLMENFIFCKENHKPQANLTHLQQKFPISLRCERTGLTQDWYILPHCFKGKPDNTCSCNDCFRWSTLRVRHVNKITKLFHLF